MILVIDNYDSFVHTLARYLREQGLACVVARNDEITVREAMSFNFAGVVMSPGPGRPESAGICLPLLADAPQDLPILGVCLGHQCLAEAFGGRVVRARRPLHGQASLIRHDDSGLFAGAPNPFWAGRYHSLIATLDDAEAPLRANAWSEDGEIMGLYHAEAPYFGLQFHPESVLTDIGPHFIQRFAEIVKLAR